MSGYTCASCATHIDTSHVDAEGYCGGSGYAIWRDEKICYPCSGKIELLDMSATGKGMLYLTGAPAQGVGAFGQRFTVSDWPGSFKFDVYGLKHSHHNFAGANGRRDFYFDYEGRVWHGVNIGDMDCARVYRTKRKAGAK